MRTLPNVCSFYGRSNQKREGEQSHASDKVPGRFFLKYFFCTFFHRVVVRTNSPGGPPTFYFTKTLFAIFVDVEMKAWILADADFVAFFLSQGRWFFFWPAVVVGSNR